jgi:hypothetical protein
MRTQAIDSFRQRPLTVRAHFLYDTRSRRAFFLCGLHSPANNQQQHNTTTTTKIKDAMTLTQKPNDRESETRKSQQSPYAAEPTRICSTDGCTNPLTKGPGYSDGVCHTCNKVSYQSK